MNWTKTALHSALAAGALTFTTFNDVPEAEAAGWTIGDKGSYERPHQLAILLGIPYCCGDFGLDPGVLYGFPIVKDGFLPINDSFYLEFALWTHIPLSSTDYFGVTPSGGVRWNFHLMEEWDAYAAVRTGISVSNVLHFHYSAVVGSTWKFSKAVGLRGEVGAHALGGDASIGIEFSF